MIDVTWTLFISAVIMLGLAALLLIADAGKPPNRVLALILSLGASRLLLSGSARIIGTTDAVILVHSLIPYLQFGSVAALLRFLSVYPRRRGFLGTPGGAWALTAAVGVLSVLYAINHNWFWTLGAGIPKFGYQFAGPGLIYADFGPLLVIGNSALLLYALLGLKFAWHHHKGSTDENTSSHGLVAIGLLTGAIFDGFLRTTGLAEATSVAWGAWGFAFYLLPALGFPVAMLGLGVLLWTAVSREDEAGRRALLGVLFVGSAGVSAAMIAYGFPDATSFSANTTILLMSFWRLMLPITIALALLRYHFFGLDLAVKRTIHAGSITAVFALVYFIGSELVEGMVSNMRGDWFGFLAAASLAAAFRPLHNVTGKVAGLILPNAKSVSAMDSREKAAFYLDQYLMAMDDGNVDPKEAQALELLRQRLGITRDAVARAQPGAAPPGASAGSAG